MDAATENENVVELKIVQTTSPDESKAMGAEAYAQSFVIATDSDSIKAQEASERCNKQIKALDDARKAQTIPLDEAKKKIMLWWNKPISAYRRAKEILDKKVLTYVAEQQQIARENQRKADAIAAAERKRLADIAEAARVKAENEAAAKRKAAEEAAAAGRAAEAAKLQAQANRIEEKAEAKADQFTMRAATVVAPTIQVQTAKAAGASFRDNWKWRVKDKAKINPTFMMSVPNEAAIDGIVKSMKGEAASIVGEGIEIFNEPILATRRA